MGCCASKSRSTLVVVQVETGTTADEVKIAQLQEAQDKAALGRFVGSVWAFNAVDSLRRLLDSPQGVSAFEAFLKTEYSEQNLDFYKATRAFSSQSDASMSPETFKAEADRLYHTFVKTGAEEQVNLPHTMQVSKWAGMAPKEKRQILDRACTEIMKMMSMDTFPRFIQSEQCDKLMSELSETETAGTAASTLAGTLAKSQKGLPGTRTEWLKWLASIASILPACVVVSDMTKKDQPLAFVNEFFCEMTGYPASECVGVNCRFLQNDMRSQEAVRLTREGIEAHKEVKVTFTNFRKDGTKFQNLVTMKPIFDEEERVAFYIGVQYPVTSQSMEAFKLVQHSRLLSLLPSRVRFARSRAGAGHKIAVSVTPLP